MQVDTFPTHQNQAPAPEQVIITDEQGQQRLGTEYSQAGQTMALGDQLRASEPTNESEARATHVIVETDDGQQLLIRQTGEASYDIASTTKNSSAQPRREAGAGMLAGTIANVGEPLVLGKDPDTGRSLKTRGAITKITAFNMMDEPVNEPAVEHQSDSVQSFGAAMRAARQGGQITAEAVQAPEVANVVAALGRDIIDTQSFREGPVEALSQDRRNLFEINNDDSLSPTERAARLDEALDSYFDKIVALDGLVPETGDTAERGIPDYIPDGFMELGTFESLNPAERYNREINYVDKRAMLARYKELFTKVYSRDPTGVSQEKIDMTIAHQVAKTVYFDLPYARDDSYKPAQRGGILKMSELKSAICQQQALTSQVLLQAFGIEARLSKNAVAGDAEITRTGAEAAYGGDHVSNFIKVGESWYVFDATNYNSPPSDNGNRTFVPGIFEIPEAPDPTRQQEIVLDTKSWEA